MTRINEGIHAYEHGQWDSAKQHFEAAIAAAPELAHFIKAANLAPGNKVIWNSPALSHVTVPEKEIPMPGSDGHGH